MKTERHCQSCGSTDAEDVGYEVVRETDGYSACCNELIADPGQCVYYRCSHN